MLKNKGGYEHREVGFGISHRPNREGLSERSHLIRNLTKVREVVKRVPGR